MKAYTVTINKYEPEFPYSRYFPEWKTFGPIEYGEALNLFSEITHNITPYDEDEPWVDNSDQIIIPSWFVKGSEWRREPLPVIIRLEAWIDFHSEIDRQRWKRFTRGLYGEYPGWVKEEIMWPCRHYALEAMGGAA